MQAPETSQYSLPSSRLTEILPLQLNVTDENSVTATAEVAVIAINCNTCSPWPNVLSPIGDTCPSKVAGIRASWRRAFPAQAEPGAEFIDSGREDIASPVVRLCEYSSRKQADDGIMDARLRLADRPCYMPDAAIQASARVPCQLDHRVSDSAVFGV